MKKFAAFTLTLALCACALAGCASDSSSAAASGSAPAASGSAGVQSETPAGAGELNLYAFDGMFPQEVLDGFEAETGIHVNYSVFDTDETMLARLQTAEGGDYDVVIADDYIIKMAIDEGLVAELDKSLIPNIGNVNPVYQGQFFDPEDKYTVPHGAGIMTIVYDPALVENEITGYADLWDESLADSLAIIGNYRVVDGMALKVMGESYNTTDAAVIAEAGERLLELAPNIRAIQDANTQDLLISGEVSAAVMYTSQAVLALTNRPDLEVVYPSEGVGFGLMAQFVPVNAPNPEAAHAFINYLLEPEVSAQCFESENFGYYCTNQAAEDYLTEERRALLTLPEDFFETNTVEMIETISAEADEAHMQAWTAFRSACGA